MIAKQINQFVFSKQKMKKNWIEKKLKQEKGKRNKSFPFCQTKSRKKNLVWFEIWKRKIFIFKFENNEKDENICSAIKNKIDSLIRNAAKSGVFY